MRPYVIMHNAISANGSLTGFDVDMGLYYRLAGDLGCDADIVGSGTIIAAPEGAQQDDPDEAAETPSGSGGTLVVPDSGGRVRCWGFLQDSGYWGRFVSLACDATPEQHLRYLERRHVGVVRTPGDRVDLAAALEALAREHGVSRVRTDSGGGLNAALLRAGLVDEISLLVAPVAVAGPDIVPLLRPEGGVSAGLSLLHAEPLEGGHVWLRYRVA